MENFQKSLSEAERHLEIAEHMTYLTYPLIDEKRILLKIFDEIFNVVDSCVHAITYYENILKKSEDHLHIKNFVEEFSKKYNLEEKEINLLFEIKRSILYLTLRELTRRSLRRGSM